MKAISNTVLYFALGEPYIAQAIFSLVSLANIYLPVRPSFEIIAYTDQPEKFDWLRHRLLLKTVKVSREEILQFTEPEKDILKAKIILLRNALNTASGNYLYVDTDTIFIKKIDKLFNKIDRGRFIMHKPEYRLWRGRQLHSGLCPMDISIDLASGMQINITGSTPMWNAGVIGISSRNEEVINNVVLLYERFYRLFPSWHAEQFCFSIIFSRTGKLTGCRRFIFHYWHSKGLAENYQMLMRAGCGTDGYSMEAAFQIAKRIIYHARYEYYKLKTKKFLVGIPLVYLLYKVSRAALRRSRINRL